MSTPVDISETIINAFYDRSGSATCFQAEIRPIRERYNNMKEAGFNAEAIIIADNLLSCAHEERILPGGAYPHGEPKTAINVYDDFCKSIRTRVKGNEHIFKIQTLEPAVK
jgi:uncharacterized Fe-S cluster protein YjdI